MDHLNALCDYIIGDGMQELKPLVFDISITIP